MVSLNLPAGNELMLDAYFAGLFLAASAGSVANPPLGLSVALAGVTLGALNFGDPIAINAAANHWRDDLGGDKIGPTMKDLGISIKNAYANTVGGSWTGDAQAKFYNYLERLENIGKQFDETGNEIKQSLQNFAIATLVADLALIAVTWACGGIMVALLPGMVPVGETAPAISTIAVQLLIALGAFAGQVAVLAGTGAVQVGNIDYEIGLLTKRSGKTVSATSPMSPATTTRSSRSLRCRVGAMTPLWTASPAAPRGSR